MRKSYFLLLLLYCGISLGQSSYYPGQVITKTNDTINVRITLNCSNFNVNKLIYVQDKLTVTENGTVKDYFPGDIKGFRIRLEKGMAIFDDVDGEIFAERLYINKVLLYKVLKRTTAENTFRFYMFRKTNEVKWKSVIAFGFSRLITKKDLLPLLEDCKAAYDKIESDAFKIKDEAALIEFIKYYEDNCIINKSQ